MKNSNPQTLVELLRNAVASRPDSEVLRFKQGKVWTGMTASRLLERVRNVALGLHCLGIRKGDRVAMLAESSPLWTICDYAILSNGAVNVPIYPAHTPSQVKYILRETEPKLLFISTARQMHRVAVALETFANLRIVPLEPAANGANIIAFAGLQVDGARFGDGWPGAYEWLCSDVQPSDLASIIYTSGTTGEPKGAMLTHSNITWNAITSGACLGIEPDDVMLSFLPLSHIFERTVLYLCMHRGVQINYASGIETLAADLREVRPTLMSTVPRLLEKMYTRMQKSAADAGTLKKQMFKWSVGVACRLAELESKGKPLPLMLRFQRHIADRAVYSKVRQSVGGRMRRIVSGGAALSPHIGLFFTGAGIPVLQGYGLSETSPVISVDTLEKNRFGSVGRPLPGIEVKIARDGDILTRGPHVFLGYFSKPAETAAAFTDDGWFKTGDIGYFDEEGFLFITARKKELFKTCAGKYIAPQLIEDMIRESEFVEQAVVIGDNRKYVCALIVPNFERLREWAKQQRISSSERRELITDSRVVEKIKSEIARLTRELADYERVKRVALLPEEFTVNSGELTPTLKVRRGIVEQKYGELINSLYPSAESAAIIV